jgi:UPF0271 protein
MTVAAANIDLNADVGEGYGRWQLGDDDALLRVVTSANVACGFHAGDPNIMRRICCLAVENNVSIGAQVSYPDLVGFGRRAMSIARGDLTNDILYQLGALEAFAHAAGGRIHYVKPHGALNNTCDTDVDQASAIVEAIGIFDPTLPVLALPGSQLEQQARARLITVVPEAYPDRAYDRSGRLVPRSEPGAVLHESGLIAQRAVDFAKLQRVTSIEGEVVTVEARSLCLHGDNADAVASAHAVRRALLARGVALVSFAGT